MTFLHSRATDKGNTVIISSMYTRNPTENILNMYIGATPVPDTESETGMVRAQQSISTKGTTDQPNLMQFKYGLLLFFFCPKSLFLVCYFVRGRFTFIMIMLWPCYRNSPLYLFTKKPYLQSPINNEISSF
jgi:hypothetical protein